MTVSVFLAAHRARKGLCRATTHPERRPTVPNSNPVCAAFHQCPSATPATSLEAAPHSTILSAQPCRTAQTPRLPHLWSQRRIPQACLRSPSGNVERLRLPRLRSPRQIHQTCLCSPSRMPKCHACHISGDHARFRKPGCAATQECPSATHATCLDPATESANLPAQPLRICRQATPATSPQPAPDSANLVCAAFHDCPNATPATSLEPATDSASLTAQPLRGAQVPRMQRLRSPRGIGSPVCAAPPGCPRTTPATPATSPRAAFRKPACATPREMSRGHACHVSGARAGFRKPCLRSLAGMPKCHACYVSGDRAGLRNRVCAAPQGRPSATPATSPQPATDSANLSAQPPPVTFACRLKTKHHWNTAGGMAWEDHMIWKSKKGSLRLSKGPTKANHQGNNRAAVRFRMGRQEKT